MSDGRDVPPPPPPSPPPPPLEPDDNNSVRPDADADRPAVEADTSVSESADDVDGRPATRSRLRRLRWPVLVVGLLIVGASLGHLLIPRETPYGSGVLIDPAALAEEGDGTERSMPSVLGLDVDVARQVLADAGLGSIEVRTVDRPAAGPAGSVVTQDPAAGSTGVDAVSLTLSSPVLIPDVIGKSVADARAQLEKAGAAVQLDPIIDPTLPASTVRDVYPPVGSEAPSVITLTVVDTGDALSLATVGTVDSSGCSTVDEAVLNGTSVGSSVSCEPGNRSGYVEYALSRGATALDALVGTDDRGGAGGARVRILGDGRELAAVDVSLGRTVPVRVDTRNVLRLRIEVTGASGATAPDVVLGDARLSGTPAGLDLIAAQ
ncbi:PASTA domain-containing protein [Rhodococcoides kroppenstedtii]|uniref:PASTA domain-containing protein n=1 Tax=Rhodococcoides kroppenstedtii TaxID=293050 RepID=UPI003637D45F